MTNLPNKIAAIQQLFSNNLLLDIALKDALDFVEEYGNDAAIKMKIVDLSWQLRQLKKQKNTQESVFLTQKQAILDLLMEVAQAPLSTESVLERPALVQLRQIEKRFQSHNFTLNNVDLDFHLGKIIGIVGANANGKSTLIKIIVGELLPNSGTIKFPYFSINEPKNGNKNSNKNFHKNSWLELKSKIAYVPQELPEWHGSLRDNLCIEATLHGITGKENILRVDFILERLGLKEFINRQWHELSGGYKLRFALAKALVWKPAFLVLDEPLANLDMASQMVVLQDLKELVKSNRFPLGIVVTSQHIHEIEQIADQLVVIEQGQIVYEGAPKAFKADGENRIFEFACEEEWTEINDILRGSPMLSLQRQGAYFIVQYNKNQFSTAQFLAYLMDNNIALNYFRDITFSVKQLFLTV